MTLSQTVAAATEMGVPPRQAVMARLRYLMTQVTPLERQLWSLKKRAEAAQTKRSREGYEVFIRIAEKDLAPLKSEASVLESFINRKRKLPQHTERISPRMEESARNYPIEQLLDQETKGASKVACCPFHTDKSPSAYIKHNMLFCAAGCRPKSGKKGWNTIDFLMDRDGLSFREAVLELLRLQ